MKRRLTIARCLINDPDILILDEPTTGLDPQARHVVWDRLFSLKQRGVTLILTTHYMDEAEQLCDRLVVMDHGKIAAEGTPRDLIARYSTPEVLELRFAPGDKDDAVLKIKELVEAGTGAPDTMADFAIGRAARASGGFGGVVLPGEQSGGSSPRGTTVVTADRILLYAADGDDFLARVHRAGLEPLTELVRRSTLEDVFLHLTGRTLID
jgi:lipooligosaccharide transport system ATP-binding protein